MKPLNYTAKLLLFMALSYSAHAAELEPYTFEGPDNRQVEAQIGHFYVPENRKKQDSRQIQLSFVKLPSTAKQPAAPIVYLAGGPGGSATGTAKGRRFPLFMKLREIADVILFDQRGTGLSRNDLSNCDVDTPPLELPSLADDVIQKTITDIKHCVKQWQQQGIDLDGYNTKQNAADLVTLKETLGVDKINLWGISYGSHLAFATVKYHPEIIDRMVLASLEGLDHTVKLPGRVHHLIEQVAQDLKTNSATKDRYPDLVGDLRSIMQQLQTEPVITPSLDYRTQQPITVGIGAMDLQFALSFIFLRDPEYLSKLPRIVKDMKAGNFGEIGAYIASIKSYASSHSPMGLAMDVASGISPERWKLVQEQAPHSLVGRTTNFPFPDINTHLPVNDLGDEFREEVKSDIPSLFISGTLDGRTLYETQMELARNFSNASVITVVGGGHNVFMVHPAIGESVYRFFSGEVVKDQRIVLEPLVFE